MAQDISGRLQDKVSIITGAGGGIGKAIAARFAAEGSHVVIADINLDLAEAAAREICHDGGDVLAVKTDVSSKDSVTALVQHVMEIYGRIDILVNNAGIMHSTPLADIAEAEWDRIMAVNLKGVFLTCQAAVPVMESQGGGCIINMASNSGRDGGVKTGLAYAASKAGVIGFSRGLAKKVARHHITCNCIAPGTTRSDMLKSFSPDDIKALEAAIPVGRLGEPADIAEMAVFLAGPHGGFVTGAVMDINGGLFIG
jgi:NAD(P)-dependent dehydrogenase (short-subunit alcohol dehydrogenase family)